VFPLIKENKIWLGVNNGGTKWFQVQDDYDIKTESRKKIVDGTKYFSMGSIMWFTNLDHRSRHQKLTLMPMADNLKFSKHEEISGKTACDRYDNYDAIEVPYIDAIPSDYDGAMGVPITFLDEYNPDQFEIIGMERPLVYAKTGKVSQFRINGKEIYARIVIRHRHPTRGV